MLYEGVYKVYPKKLKHAGSRGLNRREVKPKGYILINFNFKFHILTLEVAIRGGEGPCCRRVVIMQIPQGLPGFVPASRQALRQFYDMRGPILSTTLQYSLSTHNHYSISSFKLFYSY